MFESISQQFRGACMMLVRDDGHQVAFLGTAFLVHDHGYLLTAAHLVHEVDNLCVAPTETDAEFFPLTYPQIVARSVHVAQIDHAHDVALLKITQEVEISVPDDFLGTTTTLHSGGSVVSLGYAFGHEQIHTILTATAIISAKIRTPNGTNLLLFNHLAHAGDIGGPLINAADGHIVGVVNGRFDPAEIFQHNLERQLPSNINLSYAVAIEYGLALMGQEGILPQPPSGS